MSYSDSEDDDAGAYDVEEYEYRSGTGTGSGTGSGTNGGSSVDFRMDRLPQNDDGTPKELIVNGMRGRKGISGNTGVKGVKEDYEQSKQALKQINRMKQIRQQREINKRIKPTPTINTNEQKEKEKKSREQEEEEEEEEEDEDEDEDLALFERYKADQIKAYQSSLPVFGSYNRLESKLEMGQLVKQEHEGVYILIHVYDNSIDACIRLHLVLEELCALYDFVRFVRIHVNDCFPRGYNKAGLPTLLVYKGGELLHSAVRITDGLPRDFTDSDVIRLLQAKKLLVLPTGMEQRVQERRKKKESGLEEGVKNMSIKSGNTASPAPVVSHILNRSAALSEDEEEESD